MNDYREIRKATDPIAEPLWLSILNAEADLPSETMVQLIARRGYIGAERLA